MGNTCQGIKEIMTKKNQTKIAETTPEKKAMLNRLSRIVGQINGVKKMIEEDRDCGDVLIQMMAISSSIKSTQRSIFENNFSNDLVERIKNGDKSAVDELSELLKRI
ncbi:MAG: metal-sensitive transcriptional regulator [Clostridia bacterium]|nr:metal-sensitive transcriptional regulator [Clostridia bacterium]